MIQRLARVPAALVAAASALWVLVLVATPIIYARVNGWGHYWAFSFGETLRGILVLFGPPLLLVVVWRRARRRNPGEGAV